MPPTLNILTPKDDDFWLELSADIVKNSILRLNDAAGKLYNFVSWFFTIFTASAIFSFTINKPNEALIYLTPLPYILLTLGISKAIEAQMTIKEDFFYNVPASIDKAYKDAFQKKFKKLTEARWWVFFGVVGSAFIIFYSFVFSKENELEKVKENYFETGYSMKKESNNILSITGYLPASASVDVKAFFQNSSTKKDTLMLTTSFLNSKEGNFSKSYEMPKTSNAGTYLVTIEWKDKDYIRSLTKEVSVSK